MSWGPTLRAEIAGLFSRLGVWDRAALLPGGGSYLLRQKRAGEVVRAPQSIRREARREARIAADPVYAARRAEQVAAAYERWKSRRA